MIKSLLKSIVVLAVLCVPDPSAWAAPSFKAGESYHVLTALHVVRKSEVYWVNYTRGEQKIPAGAKVTVNSIDNKRIDFAWMGKVYRFDYKNNDAGAPVDEMLAKFFSKEDPTPKIKAMSEKAQAQISRGAAEGGMTKWQVLYSIGVPAYAGQSKTFNLQIKDVMNADQWIYHYNKFNRFTIRFANGKVQSRQE